MTILDALALGLTGVNLVLWRVPRGVLQVRERRQRQPIQMISEKTQEFPFTLISLIRGTWAFSSARHRETRSLPLSSFSFLRKPAVHWELGGEGSRRLRDDSELPASCRKTRRVNRRKKKKKKRKTTPKLRRNETPVPVV